MNCTEAKKIPITYYLHTIGITPKDVKNGSAWYCSPFRQETKPSFKVDRQNNIWYDFGTGSGGNILDLVMNLNKTGIPGALLILQKPELSKPDLSFSEQQSSNPANIKIKHLQPLQNRALIEYLNSRKITPAKAANYVQEAYYTVNEKQYFALAFKNDRGGFELRNKYFKGSSSPKAVTTISGHKQAVNIFEGFIDFLSALEHYHTTKPTGTCIVLNSVSNLDTIINTLEQYEQINLYLDNDNAGNQAAETIKRTHPKVKDYSKIIYEDFKDMNEFLTSGHKKSTIQ
jgi:DNA primase